MDGAGFEHTFPNSKNVANLGVFGLYSADFGWVRIVTE